LLIKQRSAQEDKKSKSKKQETKSIVDEALKYMCWTNFKTE